MAQDPQDDPYAHTRPESTRFIRFQIEQGIARIVLNRPPGNVLSVEMMEEIASALDALEYQREVKLVVFSAEGKYFSAGFELGDHQGDRAYVMLEAFHRIFEGLAKLDKPTLSVVAGRPSGPAPCSPPPATSPWPRPARVSGIRRSRAACSTRSPPPCCRGWSDGRRPWS